MLEDLNCEDYEAQVKTRFSVSENDGLELELVEVVRKTATPLQDMFSLTFSGPATSFLPQRIYRLRHDVLGDGELFLVPVAQEDDRFRYEAGFNRLKTPE